jgi:subfamily B ATP-binding cassette protein MsbA
MDILGRLFQFVHPYRKAVIFSFVLLAFAGLFEILTTALVIPLFDDVLVKTASNEALGAMGWLQHLYRLVMNFLAGCMSLIPGNTVTQVAVALVFLTLFKGVCLYHSNYSMSRVGQGVITDLRTKIFGHILNQSMAFFSLNSTGRLMSRMGSDIEQLQEAVSTTLGELFRESVLLVSLILWVFSIDWKLASLSILIAPFAALLTVGMGKRIRAVSLKGREDTATLSDQLQQSITGMRIIKAFGMEAHEEDGYRKNSLRLFRNNVKAAAILFINSPMMELLGVVAFVPVLLYAQDRMEAGTLTLGKLGGSLFSLFRMYDPIRKLSRIHVQYQRALASGSRIMELLDTHLEIKDRPNARTLEGISDSIEFRDVCFDYVDRSGTTRVLHTINLKVPRNRVIALVGSSGSGKTTLVGLIPRFYDPTSGAILIDGTDIREYSQSSLRRQMAIVTQETFLFNDTVRNNIAYGDVHASDERIMEAARAALADDFIKYFPMKYQTMIGERGQRLSGGERQRLSIARALLRNAPILILDEATSSLDSESEQLVQRALSNLIRDRTTFVIAHRLSTIRNADAILVLDHGKIVESGTHDSLIEHDGPYRKFFSLQTEEAFASPKVIPD